MEVVIREPVTWKPVTREPQQWLAMRRLVMRVVSRLADLALVKQPMQ